MSSASSPGSWLLLGCFGGEFRSLWCHRAPLLPRKGRGVLLSIGLRNHSGHAAPRAPVPRVLGHSRPPLLLRTSWAGAGPERGGHRDRQVPNCI